MCVLGVNAGRQKHKGYRSGEREPHNTDPVITDVGLVVRLTLNPHTARPDRRNRHRRMRLPAGGTEETRYRGLGAGTTAAFLKRSRRFCISVFF